MRFSQVAPEFEDFRSRLQYSLCPHLTKYFSMVDGL
jgi:hypothetical protein